MWNLQNRLNCTSALHPSPCFLHPVQIFELLLLNRNIVLLCQPVKQHISQLVQIVLNLLNISLDIIELLSILVHLNL
ncbi:hypothetical protein I3842_14G088900 [Carya illinoinensis]|uniref:Uncharacterized protein n=1 Tax=Carya illinoinensis TaxID=32201 RepID=A0A922DD01_CARIL|nr:hypothetical protein I3842_14G088900 [Carya illinoinensis]